MVTDTLALAKVCNDDLNTSAQEWEGIADGLREAAQAGDSEAEFKVGEIHYDRRGYIKGPDGKQVKDQNWHRELRLAFQWFS